MDRPNGRPENNHEAEKEVVSNQGTTDQQARHESSVKTLYQDTKVAEDYIQDRFTWSWSRLLHDRQVRLLNASIRRHGAQAALELAPGPARLTTQVEGLERGVAVEASAEMLEVARRRIEEKGLDKVWDFREGNAFDLSSIEETFDLVYTFRFIRHFELEERKRLYREVSARLKPTGVLIFDVVHRAVAERQRAKRGSGDEEGLPVYDALYTEEEFRVEMDASGFEVVSMHPTLRHFELQVWISHRGDSRIRSLSNLLVRFLEMIPGPQPLEWVAVVRKKA